MVKTKVLVTVLKKLEGKKGYLDPKDLVEYSEPVTSETHELFEWNNTKAAEEYRIWQARHVIARVRVEVAGRKTDRYFNAKIEVNNVPVRGYFGVEKVLSDDQLYAEVIRTALSEIKYWQKKFREIEKLRKVVNAEEIDRIEASL